MGSVSIACEAGMGEARTVDSLLRKYGIRYKVFDGEVSIHYDDLKKFLKLCKEGKLPKSIC